MTRRPQIARGFVDDRCLGPAERVRAAILTPQSDCRHPRVHEACVLPGANMVRMVGAAGEGVVIRIRPMGLAETEAILADRASRFLKAELKRAGVTYAELAERLKEYGLTTETEVSIKAKLRRGTFAATFFLATIAALGMDGMRLDDL